MRASIIIITPSISTARALVWLIAFVFLNRTRVTADPLTADNLPHTHRLLEDLFRFYRKEIRPVANDSIPVEVTVHLWFKQVLKVDEIDQILTVYAWVEEYWQDDFLTWEPSAYGGVEILHVPADRIWRPDLMIYNNADMNIQENELTTNAVLNYTGSVMCFRAMITKITCNLDMTYFPFDQQNCSMMLASWSSDGSKVTVVPKKADNNLVYYIENTEWKLLEFLYKQQTKYYDCCPEAYPDITYYFVLERNPSYYILNLIIPSVFITVVTMVGFFTPYSSTGENTEKVSLGVTALLSLAIILLMVADKMPATSKVIPLIGKYYIGLIWLIFAATIITTVTLRLQSKGNAGKPLSEDTKRVFFKYIARFLFMKLDLPVKPPPSSYQQRRPSANRVVYGEQKKNATTGGYTATVDPSPLLMMEPTSELNGGIGEWYGRYRRVRIGAGVGGGGGGGGGAPAILDPSLLAVQYSIAAAGKKNLQSVDQNQNESPVWRRRRYGGGGCDLESSTILYGFLNRSLADVVASLESIDHRMAWGHGYESVQREWGQLARVVERLLMIVFIIGTIMFAALVTVLAIPMPLVTFWPS